jgi:hypothetical protein
MTELRYFEDLAVGEVHKSGSIEVTATGHHGLRHPL